MSTVLRFVHVSLSLPSASFFRRTGQLLASYVGSPSRLSIASVELLRSVRIPDMDDVVWSVVSAVEAVALVSFFCFFYLFCGCTV